MGDERAALAEIWPLFGLAITTPRLVLRLPTDDQLVTVARLSGDIHGPDERPFSETWNLGPDDERERGVLAFNWRLRSEWTAEAWRLLLAVEAEGEIVGCQEISAKSFAVRRTVSSGSWLHRPRHGQGIGTEMRAAILHLAFAGLGAERAETAAFDDNAASQRVSERNGYRQEGDEIDEVDGIRRRCLRYVLDRGAWEGHRRVEVEIDGLDACREAFGIA